MTTHCCPSYPCPICQASAIQAARVVISNFGPMKCDHIFPWNATIPPSFCPKCGQHLGEVFMPTITCS